MHSGLAELGAFCDLKVVSWSPQAGPVCCILHTMCSIPSCFTQPRCQWVEAPGRASVLHPSYNVLYPQLLHPTKVSMSWSPQAGPVCCILHTMCSIPNCFTQPRCQWVEAPGRASVLHPSYNVLYPQLLHPTKVSMSWSPRQGQCVASFIQCALSPIASPNQGVNELKPQAGPVCCILHTMCSIPNCFTQPRCQWVEAPRQGQCVASFIQCALSPIASPNQGVNELKPQAGPVCCILHTMCSIPICFTQPRCQWVEAPGRASVLHPSYNVLYPQLLHPTKVSMSWSPRQGQCVASFIQCALSPVASPNQGVNELKPQAGPVCCILHTMCSIPNCFTQPRCQWVEAPGRASVLHPSYNVLYPHLLHPTKVSMSWSPRQGQCVASFIQCSLSPIASPNQGVNELKPPGRASVLHPSYNVLYPQLLHPTKVSMSWSPQAGPVCCILHTMCSIPSCFTQPRCQSNC